MNGIVKKKNNNTHTRTQEKNVPKEKAIVYSGERNNAEQQQSRKMGEVNQASAQMWAHRRGRVRARRKAGWTVKEHPQKKK